MDCDCSLLGTSNKEIALFACSIEKKNQQLANIQQ